MHSNSPADSHYYLWSIRSAENVYYPNNIRDYIRVVYSPQSSGSTQTLIMERTERRECPVFASQPRKHSSYVSATIGRQDPDIFCVLSGTPRMAPSYTTTKKIFEMCVIKQRAVWSKHANYACCDKNVVRLLCCRLTAGKIQTLRVGPPGRAECAQRAQYRHTSKTKFSALCGGNQRPDRSRHSLWCTQTAQNAL